MRVARGSSVLVRSPQFVAADGESPADCGDTPTVAVTNILGDTLTAPTVTKVASTEGLYEVALTSATHTIDVDLLSLTWTGTVAGGTQTLTQVVEVVGHHLATIADLRAMPGCAATDGVSVETLRRYRDRFAEIVESQKGVAYQERVASTSFAGGCAGFWLPWPHVTGVRFVSVNGAAVTSEITAELPGYITRPAMFLPPPQPGQFNVVVVYEHGYADTPALVREACCEYVSQSVTRAGSAMRNVVYQTTGDGGVTRYSAANGTDKPTGFADVDDMLRQVSDERRWTW